MKTILLALFAAGAVGATASAQVVNYVESISGDLSGNGVAPTSFDVDLGLNTFAGTMGRPSSTAPIDRDIFTFQINPWEQVTALWVLEYSPVAAPGPIGSFLALSGSNTISIASPALHLSNALVAGPGDYLPVLAAGSYSDTLGSQPATLGLTAPLGGGTYTLWFQELTTNVNYTIGIAVAAVPEPSTYAVVGAAALLGLVVVRRRPRR